MEVKSDGGWGGVGGGGGGGRRVEASRLGSKVRSVLAESLM